MIVVLLKHKMHKTAGMRLILEFIIEKNNEKLDMFSQIC